MTKKYQQSVGHDVSKSKKRARGNNSKDGLISRTEMTMLSIPANSLTLLFPVEERALLKMMTVTKIQKLTANVMGVKNARSSSQILPEWLLEIVFAMTSKVVQTCPLTLKM